MVKILPEVISFATISPTTLIFRVSFVTVNYFSSMVVKEKHY